MSHESLKGYPVNRLQKSSLKAGLLSALLILLCSFAHAQKKSISSDCGLDFRPIYMHRDLPKGAVYENQHASPEARARDVVHRLTFDELLALTGGTHAFFFPGVERLGIPAVYFDDGPEGVHQKTVCGIDIEKSTAFPSGLALAATWDRTLAYQYARSIAEEDRYWGVNVLLGPDLNMYRNSEGGRDFETFGEDPYLASEIAVSYVKGVQSAGVIPTMKQFIGNDEEFVRHEANVEIGPQALREIYLVPFQSVIQQDQKHGALAVMAGNNFVNGYPGAADLPLEKGILRDEYGFKGMIMSDWANSEFWPNHQSLELGSGNSLLMGTNKTFAAFIRQEVSEHPDKKKVFARELGKMVQENLYTLFKSGVYDRPYRDRALLSKFSGHKSVALKTAEEAITLLKNQNHILPLVPSQVRSIAVIGSPEALADYRGSGSGAVSGYDRVDFLAGLRSVYGQKILYGKSVDDNAIRHATAVLYFIDKPAGEGRDVPYALPSSVNATISRLSSLNRNVVVIFSGGNGFPMPWLSKARGLIFGYLLGQESGTAMANVLSGKVDPSGKLPFTIEASFEQSPAYGYNRLPNGKYFWGGMKSDSRMIYKEFGRLPIRYNEGTYIGYRWYEKKGIKPLFAFGYGLSYTTFKYSELHLSSRSCDQCRSISASFELTNTGHLAGAETAQLYVHFIDSKAGKSVKWLKGFQRVFLEPGESRQVSLTLPIKSLATWDSKDHQWETQDGEYAIEVGSSSSNIRLKSTMNVEK
jgi:beta-glucosidase